MSRMQPEGMRVGESLRGERLQKIGSEKAMGGWGAENSGCGGAGGERELDSVEVVGRGFRLRDRQWRDAIGFHRDDVV